MELWAELRTMRLSVEFIQIERRNYFRLISNIAPMRVTMALIHAELFQTSEYRYKNDNNRIIK